MSRVRVFDLRNRAIGEFMTNVTRGYSLSGSIMLQGGLSSTVMIPTDAAQKDWLQLGRVVYIEDEEDLVPPWAGIIDTPWKALAPVTAAIYNAEYIFNTRSPDTETTSKGSFKTVLTKLIGLVNLYDDCFLRLGTLGALPSGQRELKITQTPLWGQINDFGKREGVEFLIRPLYAEKKPLFFYLDAAQNFGVDTGVILHDGDNHNLRVTGAQVGGKIINRMIGIGKEDSTKSRPKTIPLTNAQSISLYDMRSEVRQFRTISTQSALDQATANALKASARPVLTLDVIVSDPDIFPHCRPGNWFDVTLAHVYLPGGRKGWRGKMRMPQMVYDEDSNTITATLKSYL